MTTVPPTPGKIMEDRSPAGAEFHRMLLVAHYVSLRIQYLKRQPNSELAAKTSVAMCRYCTEVPVDRVFYEAGLHCKNAGMINMAFFFLNRYLDLADAIEDPENAAIDNTDFLETDIPSPYDLDLPESSYVKEDQVEEIRDVVLGWSMDQSVKAKMDL